MQTIRLLFSCSDPASQVLPVFKRLSAPLLYRCKKHQNVVFFLFFLTFFNLIERQELTAVEMSAHK